MVKISSFDDYFQVLDKEVLDKIASDYPKLTLYYSSLKESFEGLDKLSPFQMVQQLLAVDAQIQILIEYLRWDLIEVHNEEIIIQQIIEDSRYYYLEKTGLCLSDEIPLGVLYLGDRVEQRHET